MIFLWNSELVLSEILELATLHISRDLGITPDMVSVSVTLEDGLIKPTFEIKSGDEDHDPKKVEAVMRDVWSNLRGELSTRLKGLYSKRHDCKY